MASFEIRYIVHEPCEENMDMWMAEIPGLPGCNVWVEDRDEVDKILRSVAWDFIDALLENKQEVHQWILESWYRAENR